MSHSYFNAKNNDPHHFFFTDPVTEAQSVLAQTAIVSPLTDFGLIQISGAKAQAFLQGQLSCDMNLITENVSSWGAYCTIQGRVQSLFMIFLFQSHYFLLLPKDLLAPTANELKKYALFSKVTVEDVSQQWDILGMVAPNMAFPSVNEDSPPTSSDLTQLLMTSLAPTPLSDEKNDNGIKELGIALVFSPLTPAISFVISPKEKTPLLWPLLQNTFYPVGNQAFDLALITLGIPMIDKATSEQFLPHDIDLPALEAVSFKKGCYRGQEIIARMEYRGKLKKHLYSAIFEAGFLPKPGSKMQNAQKKAVGECVNTAWVGAQQGIALMILAEDLQFDHTTFEIEDQTILLKEKKSFR